MCKHEKSANNESAYNNEFDFLENHIPASRLIFDFVLIEFINIILK